MSVNKRKKHFVAGWLMFTAVSGRPALRAQRSLTVAMASSIAAERHATDPESAAPPASLEDALRIAFSSADAVFTGEVIEIRPSEGAVVVSWRVEDAVRGVQPGGIYDLREWAGLWNANGARYAVGQRALVMLHSPSAAGYASPVSGGEGIVPLRGDARDGVLNLHLLAQQVVKRGAARLHPTAALRIAGGRVPLSEALPAQSIQAATALPQAQPRLRGSAEGEAATVEVSEKIPAEPGSTPDAAEESSHVDAAVVLALMHAWQRASELTSAAR